MKNIRNKAKIKNNLLFFLAICFYSVFANAQDLKILSIDSTAWPKLKVSVAYQGKTKFSKDLIKISRNDQLVEFVLREASADNQKTANKAIYILIETSGNTYGSAIADIRSGVRSYIDQLADNDMMNVGYFSSIDADSMGLQHISEKFNNRREGLKYELDNKVKQVKDTLFRVDLYRSIRDGLEYMLGEPSLAEHKVFIIISTGKNNSESPVSINDGVSIAKSANLPVFNILYQGLDSLVVTSPLRKLSTSTDGKFSRASNEKEILELIIEYTNMPPLNKVYEGRYDLLIDLTNVTPENQVKLDLHYEGTRQIITATNPQGLGIFSKDYQLYLLVSVGILIFILLVMLLAKVFNKKNDAFDQTEETEKTTDKKYKAEPRIQIEEPAITESIKATRVAAATPEERAKQINEVGINANLLVNMDGRVQSFPLKKLVLMIGRHESNDVILPVPTVTGKHARLELIEKEVVLTDLGSTNGTFVNGEKIKSRNLRNGDQIKMGNVEMTIKIS